MLEAYRIGMTMTLGGDVSGALAKIAGQFKEIQELVRQTNGLMANMTKTMGAMAGRAPPPAPWARPRPTSTT